MTNDGWKYDILTQSGGTINSNLKALFSHWLNEENDDLEYALFGEKATVSFKPTRDIFLMAFFKKIPYIRGLADPADGGKVTLEFRA